MDEFSFDPESKSVEDIIQSTIEAGILIPSRLDENGMLRYAHDFEKMAYYAITGEYPMELSFACYILSKDIDEEGDGDVH